MWGAVVRIFDGLLVLFAVWLAKREQEVSQNERNKLEESPADWFNGHFNGVPKPPADKDSPTN